MPVAKKLYFAMITRNRRGSGTDSRTVFILERNSVDLIHHTFEDTSQRDQNKGGANLYSLDIEHLGLTAEELRDSRVRIGIRGDDLWEPELFFVWTSVRGEPIAIETSIRTRLSSDTEEGNISTPLRSVSEGGLEMPITSLLVVALTDRAPGSGTRLFPTFQIQLNNEFLLNHDIENTPQLDLHLSQANVYKIPIRQAFSKLDVAGNTKLEVFLNLPPGAGVDNWLPKSFFVFGMNSRGSRPSEVVPLVQIEDWRLPPVGAGNRTFLDIN